MGPRRLSGVTVPREPCTEALAADEEESLVRQGLPEIFSFDRKDFPRSSSAEKDAGEAERILTEVGVIGRLIVDVLSMGEGIMVGKKAKRVRTQRKVKGH